MVSGELNLIFHSIRFIKIGELTLTLPDTLIIFKEIELPSVLFKLLLLPHGMLSIFHPKDNLCHGKSIALYVTALRTWAVTLKTYSGCHISGSLSTRSHVTSRWWRLVSWHEQPSPTTLWHTLRS